MQAFERGGKQGRKRGEKEEKRGEKEVNKGVKEEKQTKGQKIEVWWANKGK